MTERSSSAQFTGVRRFSPAPSTAARSGLEAPAPLEDVAVTHRGGHAAQLALALVCKERGRDSKSGDIAVLCNLPDFGIHLPTLLTAPGVQVAAAVITHIAQLGRPRHRVPTSSCAHVPRLFPRVRAVAPDVPRQL